MIHLVVIAARRRSTKKNGKLSQEAKLVAELVVVVHEDRPLSKEGLQQLVLDVAEVEQRLEGCSVNEAIYLRARRCKLCLMLLPADFALRFN